VGFDVAGAGAGAEAPEFVFDEEFADEGFAEAVKEKTVRLFPAGDLRSGG
jgi:hypothetical protein